MIEAISKNNTEIIIWYNTTMFIVLPVVIYIHTDDGRENGVFIRSP